MSNAAKDNELTQTIIQVMTEKKPQDVKQLANLVKERLPLTEERILAAILKLQSEEKIRLENSLKPASYIKTGRALWYWATVAVATLTAAVVFLVPEAFYPWAYLRNVLGAIFVLCLPGYTFTRLLFPTREPTKSTEENLGIAVRIALSLVMSIALAPVIVLLLNYTPWGISLTSTTLSLLTFTLVFATAALMREHQLAK